MIDGCSRWNARKRGILHLRPISARWMLRNPLFGRVISTLCPPLWVRAFSLGYTHRLCSALNESSLQISSALKRTTIRQQATLRSRSTRSGKHSRLRPLLKAVNGSSMSGERCTRPIHTIRIMGTEATAGRRGSAGGLIFVRVVASPFLSRIRF